MEGPGYQLAKAMLGCILVVGLPAHSKEIPEGSIEFTRIDPPHGELSVKPAYFVVRSIDDWVNWWNASNGLPYPPNVPWHAVMEMTGSPFPPKFDFANYMWVVASSGLKRESGHLIAFTDAYRESDGIVMFVQETVLHGNCNVSAMYFPVAIARIARSNLPITFRVRSVESDCNKVEYIKSQSAPGGSLKSR